MRLTIELPERTLLLAAAALLLVWALLKLRRIRTVRCDTSRRNLKVVVTGSSRGLGLELARHFLQLGDDVVLSSRTAAALENAALKLRREFPERVVMAVSCDVSKPKDVQALVGKAARELGRIDVLVCNAAQSAKAKTPAAASSGEEQAAIVATNLGGPLLCAAAAMKEMQRQPGGGKVFLMDGAGSRGQATPGNAAYGACKRGLVQLCASLAAEAREANKAAAADGGGGQVSVHVCSPGMVATDLLLRYATNPRSAKFINILAEEPAAVAAWLVPRMRGVTGQGAYIKFLTPAGAAWRFVTARRRRGRFVPEGASTAEEYQPLPGSEPSSGAVASASGPVDD